MEYVVDITEEEFELVKKANEMFGDAQYLLEEKWKEAFKNDRDEEDISKNIGKKKKWKKRGK